MPKANHPPRWADQLLEWFCAPYLLEEIQGDLYERFQRNVQLYGLEAARRQYGREALAFLRPSFIRSESTAHTYPALTDMFRNYAKISLRHLQKNKVNSFINVSGLALGMACCLLIGLYVYDEQSYDRFHANYDQIYRVVEKQKQPGGIFDVAMTPGPLAATLHKDFPEIEQTTRIGQWSGLLMHNKQVVEPNHILIVDPSFFSLFSFTLLQGNQATIFQSPNEVILSEAMVSRFFGANWRKQNVLGKAFTFNNDQTLTLVGIAQNPPTQSHIQFDMLMPFKWLERNDEWSMKWNSNSYHTYIQLRKSPTEATTDPTALGEKIRGHLKRYNSENEAQLLLQPLSAIYLYSNFAFDTDYGKRSDISYIRIFVTVGIIVLLIAVINFINLATARASQRAKEVGVRKSIGAQRGSLITQFLGEAALMTTLATLLSLVLAEVLLPIFNDLANKNLLLPYQLPVFWLMLVGFTVLVSFLAGIYPAFFLSSFRPISVLKASTFGHMAGVNSSRKFRQSLVIGQFVLAIILVISTVVIYRQLTFMQNTRLGFDKSQLLYVRLKGDLRGKALALKKAVEPLASVERVALATGNLVNMQNSTVIEWEGQVPKDEFLITNMNIDADFMRTTGMSLVTGRNFSAQSTTDTLPEKGAYLINETAAKRMGWSAAKAIGKQIKFWGTNGYVIGVLKDFHFQSLHTNIQPFIFRFRPKEYYFTLLVKTKPGLTARTIADVTNVYKKLEPNYPISYGFVDQDLDAQYRSEQRIGRILFCFTLLTILVSCLGLFGLVTFTAEQRTKEIGIRKVLGASVVSIVGLLSRDFVKLVLIAILIASPLAWYAMDRWLQDFAYKITLEWWVFAGAGLAAIAVALLTVSFQSIKAALVNPVSSLRAE